ncbi:hypothetical protein AWZ03_005422 [Drosophila navojoa]|uniref:Uncharacterized protein n=1 Tax=Drosophila navojoa TaxID=7232 RepID=A0A484BHK4_DRONA|nr:hypothetical protein AWZ03_005422 [Drosophila navojoa]
MASAVTTGPGRAGPDQAEAEAKSCGRAAVGVQSGQQEAMTNQCYEQPHTQPQGQQHEDFSQCCDQFNNI